MAGNGALLKHASNVTGCALAIEDVWRRAGLPDGLFRTLVVGSDGVAGLIEQPADRGGHAHRQHARRPRGGREAPARCSRSRCSSSAAATPTWSSRTPTSSARSRSASASRLINGGPELHRRQALRDRRLAPRGALERRFVERMRARRVGDPLGDGRRRRPAGAARPARRAARAGRARASRRARGSSLGGERPAGPGAFYPPTVLADVRPGMPAYDEEIFGPVAALLFVPDEEEAIRVANDSPFGLGAAVFTRDLARGEEIAARRLDAGSCFVNAFVRSDPRLPFGGVKASGYGRELGRLRHPRVRERQDGLRRLGAENRVRRRPSARGASRPGGRLTGTAWRRGARSARRDAAASAGSRGQRREPRCLDAALAARAARWARRW